MSNVSQANLHLLRVGQTLSDENRTLHYLNVLTSKPNAAQSTFWVDKIHPYTSKHLYSRQAGFLFPAETPHDKNARLRNIDTFKPVTTADHVNVLMAMLDSDPSRCKYTAAADIYKILILKQEGGFYIDNRPFENTTDALPAEYSEYAEAVTYNGKKTDAVHPYSLDLTPLHDIEVLNDSWQMFHKDLNGNEVPKGRKFPGGMAWLSPEHKEAYGTRGSENVALRNILARRAVISKTNAHFLSKEVRDDNADYFRLKVESNTFRNIDLKDIKTDLKGSSLKTAVRLLFEDLPRQPLKNAQTGTENIKETGFSAYDMERHFSSHCYHLKGVPLDADGHWSISGDQFKDFSGPGIMHLVLSRTGGVLFDLNHQKIELGITEKDGLQHHAAQAILNSFKEKTAQVFGQAPVDRPEYKWIEFFPPADAVDDISVRI